MGKSHWMSCTTAQRAIGRVLGEYIFPISAGTINVPFVSWSDERPSCSVSAVKRWEVHGFLTTAFNIMNMTPCARFELYVLSRFLARVTSLLLRRRVLCLTVLTSPLYKTMATLAQCCLVRRSGIPPPPGQRRSSPPVHKLSKQKRSDTLFGGSISRKLLQKCWVLSAFLKNRSYSFLSIF